MSDAYDHKAIEKKWQKKWQETGIYQAKYPSDKPKYYPLVEFPYPSGAGLHVGHPRPYIGLDIIARKRRREGFNVLYPMGWDAFGLPTENYALKTGKDPRVVTKENTDTFRRQIQSLGTSFDWSREINTTDPRYYKWTQWIFLQLFKHGLAYKAKATINWCPKDKIGLANEEVIDGKCERCGTPVEKREKDQWMLAITKYAQRLYDDLETVDYIERAKTQQKNWIGPSQGAEIDFLLNFKKNLADNDRRGSNGEKAHLTVFTTRPDTLFGATYLVLAPEHRWVELATDREHDVLLNKEEVRAYIKIARKKTDMERGAEGKEKTGVELKGVTAINPATKEEIPIWVADYVLAGYGTGAIMAVPAYDERDKDFAEKFNLRVKEVELVDSKKIVAEVHGTWVTKYKLRDWIFSRQRYWGEPIPMVYCKTCGWQPVPEEELPIQLPEVEKYQPTETGESPLANIHEWVNTTCPKCAGEAKRETDVMPNWAGSSWYYLRYCDPTNDKALADKKALAYWTPVDWYNGGMEHTVLHLLYSRFWHKFLFDIGAVPTPEPYKKRTSHGVILAEDGRKMSKSLGNVINPDDIVERFGADALRVYEMFMGPFDQAIAWSTDGLVGTYRFLERVIRLSEKVASVAPSEEVEIMVNQSIKKVSEDVEQMKFNTALSQIMIFSNKLAELEKVPRASYEAFIMLLAPFAPHVTEELWEKLGNHSSIHEAPWASFDKEKLETDTVTVAIQIQGKVRGTVSVHRGATQETVLASARSDKRLALLLPEKPSRVVFVPDKIVNLIP